MIKKCLSVTLVAWQATESGIQPIPRVLLSLANVRRKNTASVLDNMDDIAGTDVNDKCRFKNEDELISVKMPTIIL